MEKELKFLLDEFHREKMRHQNLINLATESLQRMLNIQEELMRLGDGNR
jgi:hypothetical protein